MNMKQREFQTIVEETKGVVLNAVRRYLSRDLTHAIDDVVQETYIRVYLNMGKREFPGETQFRNWVYTIAKNESLRMNLKCAKGASFENPGDEAAYAGIAAPGPFSEGAYELNRAIEGLAPRYRDIYTLLNGGYGETEIAERLSLPVGTVKSRVHRGKELIRRTLKSRGFDYEDEL